MRCVSMRLPVRALSVRALLGEPGSPNRCHPPLLGFGGAVLPRCGTDVAAFPPGVAPPPTRGSPHRRQPPLLGPDPWVRGACLPLLFCGVVLPGAPPLRCHPVPPALGVVLADRCTDCSMH